MVLGSVRGVVLSWQPVDSRSDPDDAEHLGDPGELVDAAGFLLALAGRPAWHAQAACRGRGPSLFFPGQGEPLEAARAICAGCPVRADCLADSLGRPSCGDNGVWAGTSPRQRRDLRRTAAAA